MGGFTDFRIRREMDENEIRLSISPEKSADVASPYAISSSVPEAAKNDNEEFKKIDQSQGQVLEISWNSISCRNQSGKNASIEQEVGRYQKCSRVTTLQGDKNDADCSRSNYRCGMHEDLLFDIMLWLPVASLLRFRSVCRLWCSLIDSSTFITEHYNHNRNKNCLLARHVLSTYSDDYDSKFCLLSGNKYEVYSNLDYKQPWYSVNDITILNSCNGIVSLLSEESGNVVLWNPATKQLRPLPESHQCLSLCNEMIPIFGFGFDAKNNDYKFVKIIYHHRNKYNNLVEVYSLRTDSWKVIHKDDVLPFQHIDCDVATCNKEICFWTGYAHHDEISPILISLDLNTEVFETMPLPVEDHQYDNCLDLLNDKLCYIRNVNLKPFESNATYFEIWMLDEYGVKESWKNICKLGPIGSPEWQLFPEIVRLSKNGESLILGCYGYGQLYLSSFDAREEDLQNPNPIPSKFVCYNKLQNPNLVLWQFVWYNESLVSLGREEDGTYK